MKTYLQKTGLFVLAFFLLLAGAVHAHQPRIVRSEVVDVSRPEISQAFYAMLSGVPHTYRIASDTPFVLYLNLLLPDRPGQKKDVSAVVFEQGNEDTPLALLNGENYEWKAFYEEFGADNYLMGPEFREEVAAGTYQVLVWSTHNDSRYVLAVGEIEKFPPAEAINALRLIPELKRDFFNSSPFTFLKSPIGIGYVVVMFVLAFVAGFIYRALVKHLAKKSLRKRARNIGRLDRTIRLLAGLVLFLLGTYTWNPLVLFFAGFCFFQAIWGWCGLYAAIGKNTSKRVRS